MDPSASLRKRSAIANLTAKPMVQPKRAKTAAQDSSSSSTPLLDKERSEKKRWAVRLEEIGVRAGEHAKLFQEAHLGPNLSAAEKTQLRNLVLVSGAHRTMAGHVRTFERFEKWASAVGMVVHPLSIDKVLKYGMFLNGRSCGPSVLPTLRAAIKWICSKLAIDPPAFDDHRFLALQASVLSERATTLKEAVPIPIPVVKELEFFVCDEDRPLAARLFIWWILCLIFASLRFDDGVHVKPLELSFKDEGLFGVAWQTKVERKRVGTRFVVPRIGFLCSEWLEVGWKLFQRTQCLDRDFWIPELNTQSLFKDEPPSFARSLQWLKYLSRDLVDSSPRVARSERVDLARIIHTFTMHSCRVTLLDAAVHAGRTTEEIGLQANWKNPGPLVLKYTRNRTGVSAVMVKQLVKDMVQEQHPVQEDDDTLLMDAPDSELQVIEYFMKLPSTGSSYEYKFHCNSRNSEDYTACKRLLLTSCSSVGDTLPDPSVLCKGCARARPEVLSFHGLDPDAAS